MKKKYSYLYLIVCCFLSISSLPAQTIIVDGIPRDTSYTVYSSFIKEKKNFPFIATVNTTIPDEIVAIEGLIYKTINKSRYRNRNLNLSIYRPNDGLSYPIILMIHGGGWNSGSPDMQKALALNLAGKGFVTATVEYRLIPEELYPAGVEDLNDAVKWLYENADIYNFDRNKIAVSGCSAGGQLAALIGTKNRDGLIKAIINIDGISTFIEPETVNRAEKARAEKSAMPVDALWLGGTYSEKSETWKDASALYWVSEKSAPVCFINSSIPRFHNGRDEHVKKLDSLGIYSEVHAFDKSPHTFWHFHPWHLSTVNYVANFLWKIFDTPTVIDADSFDLVVAQDGSGDFSTVQEAINAVPDFRKKPTRIFIRNGVYREKIIIPDTKHSLALVGEDKYKTVLSYNDYASKKSLFGDEIGTSGSASVYISPDNFTAENLTFENAAGPVGQAVAVIVRSDHVQFINCRFIGFQDTLYTHKVGSKQYYKDCYVEGTVDFIFGASTAYFENCDIYCKNNGYITAASTPQTVNFGYVFYKCRISGDKNRSFYLGRPWRPFAYVAFIECEMSNVIKAEGWNNWGKVSNEETAKFVEFANSGDGASSENRVSWSHELSEEQVIEYSKESVLGEYFFHIFDKTPDNN